MGAGPANGLANGTRRPSCRTRRAESWRGWVRTGASGLQTIAYGLRLRRKWGVTATRPSPNKLTEVPLRGRWNTLVTVVTSRLRAPIPRTSSCTGCVIPREPGFAAQVGLPPKLHRALRGCQHLFSGGALQCTALLEAPRFQLRPVHCLDICGRVTLFDSQNWLAIRLDRPQTKPRASPSPNALYLEST